MIPATTNPRRAALAAFLSDSRHIVSKPPHQPLTVTAMARSIGVAPNTLRRWLRADHHDLYWDHWASFTELWKAAQEARRGCRDASENPSGVNTR